MLQADRPQGRLERLEQIIVLAVVVPPQSTENLVPEFLRTKPGFMSDGTKISDR